MEVSVMKTRMMSLLWGVALIVAGGLFLAQNYGYLPVLSSTFWMVVFCGLSLAFFASYFVAGVRQWGWLFPATIFAALALTIALSMAGVHSSLVGAPVLASLSIPFLVAYALDPRAHRWALIPAWVMAVLTLITALADRVPGEVIGTLFMYAVALPFLVVYLTDRTRWAFLIPAGVLGVVGLIPLLTLRINPELMGSLIMFLFSLPFFIVYFAAQRAWWALIPAGSLASIGLVALASQTSLSLPGATHRGWIGSILFLGLALTFLVLWLRRGAQPTEWAKYPALVLGVLGLGGMGLGLLGWDGLTQSAIWPLVIIVAGAVLLYTSLRHKPV
jgi:hypothetical protein